MDYPSLPSYPPGHYSSVLQKEINNLLGSLYICEEKLNQWGKLLHLDLGLYHFFKSSASTLLQLNGCCFSGPEPYLNWEEPTSGARFFLVSQSVLGHQPTGTRGGATEPCIKLEC